MIIEQHPFESFSMHRSHDVRCTQTLFFLSIQSHWGLMCVMLPPFTIQHYKQHAILVTRRVLPVGSSESQNHLLRCFWTPFTRSCSWVAEGNRLSPLANSSSYMNHSTKPSRTVARGEGSDERVPALHWPDTGYSLLLILLFIHLSIMPSL